QVELACSVSDCAAARRLPDEALGVTDGLGLFATLGALEHCLPADGREAFVRFAYRALPAVFGDGVAVAEGQERPLEHAPEVVEPIPASFVRLGFDVCEVHYTLECSPLFCNHQAGAIATNRWCLLDDFDVAVR